MRIQHKFNILITSVILFIIISISVFALVYLPVTRMRAEKDVILKLDIASIELRAELNQLFLSSFQSKYEEILEKSQTLYDVFLETDKVEALKKDSEIRNALKVISDLYSLYDENINKFNKEASPLSQEMLDIWGTAQHKLLNLSSMSSTVEEGMKQRLRARLSAIESELAVLDGNLDIIHSIIIQQYEIIDKIIRAREKAAYITGLIILVVTGLIAFIAGSGVSARIVKNILLGAVFIREMSLGDLSKTVCIAGKDELSKLGEDLNGLASKLRNVFEMMRSASAEGVVLKNKLVSSADETSSAAVEIESSSRSIFEQFKTLSDKVDAALEANIRINNDLLELDGNILGQAAKVEESTASITQMISSIGNVSRITEKKKTATEELIRASQNGGTILETSNKKIEEVISRLDQVLGAADLIKAIASQTNLLAMNAAIEAAHAGDSGRGFAVVADEIRKLAEATSQNSTQISGVLKEVVLNIEEAGSLSKDSKQAFGVIDTEVKGFAKSYEEIAFSMQELSSGGEQILAAMAGLQNISVEVRHRSGSITELSAQQSESVETVSRIAMEAVQSVEEISAAISDISRSMINITETARDLGGITELLERESGKYSI